MQASMEPEFFIPSTRTYTDFKEHKNNMNKETIQIKILPGEGGEDS